MERNNKIGKMLIIIELTDQYIETHYTILYSFVC